MLDLGAGPGTASLAATAVWPAIERATLVERDAQFAELGKQLLKSRDSSPREAVYRISTSWIIADLKSLLGSSEVRVSPHDLVILSYALGEFSKTDQQRLVTSAWNSTEQFDNFTADLNEYQRKSFVPVETIPEVDKNTMFVLRKGDQFSRCIILENK